MYAVSRIRGEASREVRLVASFFSSCLLLVSRYLSHLQSDSLILRLGMDCHPFSHRVFPLTNRFSRLASRNGLPSRSRLYFFLIAVGFIVSRPGMSFSSQFFISSRIFFCHVLEHILVSFSSHNVSSAIGLPTFTSPNNICSLAHAKSKSKNISGANWLTDLSVIFRVLVLGSPSQSGPRDRISTNDSVQTQILSGHVYEHYPLISSHKYPDLLILRVRMDFLSSRSRIPLGKVEHVIDLCLSLLQVKCQFNCASILYISTAKSATAMPSIVRSHSHLISSKKKRRVVRLTDCSLSHSRLTWCHQQLDLPQSRLGKTRPSQSCLTLAHHQTGTSRLTSRRLTTRVCLMIVSFLSHLVSFLSHLVSSAFVIRRVSSRWNPDVSCREKP